MNILKQFEEAEVTLKEALENSSVKTITSVDGIVSELRTDTETGFESEEDMEAQGIAQKLMNEINTRTCAECQAVGEHYNYCIKAE